MRVTDNMRFAAASENQARINERVLDLTKQASSGVRVAAPSDDPVAFASIAAKDGALGRLNARKESLASTRGDSELSESTLASAADVMVRVKEIAVDMASGDKDAAARAAAADEVAGLKQTLIGLANTQGARGYLFGGTATNAPPFASSGAFTGNDNVMTVEIADGVTLAANTSGARAFTAAGGQDVMKDLDALSNALSTNDVAGIQSSLDPLDKDHAQVVSARGNAGIQLDRLGVAEDVGASALVTIQAARSRDADADAPSVLSALTAAMTAYQRSLAVTRQILSLSAGTSSA